MPFFQTPLAFTEKVPLILACLSSAPGHFYPGHATWPSSRSLCLHSCLFPGHPVRVQNQSSEWS